MTKNDASPCCTECAVKLEKVIQPAEINPGKTGRRLDRDILKNLLPLALMLTVFILGLVFTGFLRSRALGIPEYAVFLGIYLFAGWKVLLSAFRNILRGKVFDENFLMALATIGAIAIHALPEAAGVMLFYSIGQFFEDLALGRSRKSIQALMNIRPDFANLKTGDTYEKTDPENVVPGDIILVKPGERVPLDGIVTTGESGLDTSALTGESRPGRAVPGEEVLAGTIILSGSLTLRVTKVFGESAVARILALVEKAIAAKAPTEKFITTFARYYTPAVVFLSVMLAVLPPFVFHAGPFSLWLYRALVLLVISCPCALVMSIPLAYFAGIGRASKRGILIKGSNHIDALTRAGAVVFDKTGTLTKGVFEVVDVIPRNGYSREDLLFYAAHAEAHSSHPIALSIKSAYQGAIREALISNNEEIAGYGVRARVKDLAVLLGNDRFFPPGTIPPDAAVLEGTVAHLALDGLYAGCLLVRDREKLESARAVKELKQLGIRRIVMLSGDSEEAVRQTADRLGIEEFHAGLLPEQKVGKMSEIQKQTEGSVIFVGDGINDAPVLAAADVGIAMGQFGSDAAVETADLVLMTDDPGRIPEAVILAKKTRSVVLQTIGFVLAVKAAFITFGAFGIAGLWEAVFADVGVAVLAVLNALRVLRPDKNSG